MVTLEQDLSGTLEIMPSKDRIIRAGEVPEADYADARDVALRLAPEGPVHLLRPQYIYARAQQFRDGFPGEVAYAVRANFEPDVLRHVYAGGIDWFACDTLAEIEAAAQIAPDLKFFFAHSIKPASAIREAYTRHRVRAFVLDHPDELEKLRAHTGPDATLLVRVSGPPGALLGEGYRYGCDVNRAAWLARAVVDAGYKLGLCFNLGSQIMDPTMFDEAFLLVREVMYRARFMLDMICVGGGFPTIYDGLYPPAPEEYFAIIKKGLARLHLPRTCRVLATPGRVIVNEAVSILTRVEQRRGQMLYINDGSLGGLGSINVPWWRPTVRLIRPQGRPPARELDRYLFSGPAGYGNDTMPGPYYLPEDAKAGDYVEFGNLGAYSGSMITAFHCAPWPDMVTVGDDPMEAAQPGQVGAGYHDPGSPIPLTADMTEDADPEDDDIPDLEEDFPDDPARMPHRRR